MTNAILDQIDPQKVDERLAQRIKATLENEIKANLRGITYTYPPRTAYRAIEKERLEGFVERAWNGYEQGQVVLYGHVPFCPPRSPPKEIPREIWGKDACGFCNLFANPIEKGDSLASFVEDLIAEIELYRKIFDSESHDLACIYFGGGTPSLIKPAQYSKIFDAIRKVFGQIPNDIEVCLEAAPDTISRDERKGREKLRRYSMENGFNRISFGMQSFNREELRIIPRPADEKNLRHMKRVVLWAKEEGFTNVNIDLIMGLPKQTRDSFLESLGVATSLKPATITVYSYAKRPNTGFGRCLAKGLLAGVSEDYTTKLYPSVKEHLSAAGYRQIAPTLWVSREEGGYKKNCLTFNMVPEVGVGPGAFSTAPRGHYNVEFNVCHEGIRKIVDGWRDNVRKGKFPATHGFELNTDEARRKYVIFKLSSTGGLDVREYEELFNGSPFEQFPSEFYILSREGLVRLNEEGKITLTELGNEFSGPTTRSFFSPKVKEQTSG